MRNLHRVLIGLLIVSATACSDRLNVENLNNPDRTRALARPSDVEALIGGSFKAIWDNLEGTQTNIRPGMWNMSLESYANLANWNQGGFGSIPRAPIPNTRGNAAFDVNFQQYQTLYQAARQGAVGLARVSDPTFVFFPASAAQTNRAKSFANFVIGVALGYVAMAFDSGAVVSPNDPAGTPVPLPLAAYDSVGRAAIRYLQVADSLAGLSPAGGNGFPLPSAWLPTTTALSAANFQALCRGYRAIFRAGVARSPTEGAAVNWDSVIANANAFVAVYGPLSAFEVSLTTTTPAWTVGSPGNGDQQQMHLYGAWHQMWQFMLGMADSTTAYSAWLALPRASRASFLVVSADQRFPTGTTRAAQNTSSGIASATNDDVMPPAGNPWYMGRPYFRNRLQGNDVPGEPLASSMYDHYRFRRYSHGGGFNGVGAWPFITASEVRLLAAEGYLMKGQLANALPLIDASRVAQGGLPALTGVITTPTQAVPGGNACVPKIPDPAASFNSAVCGNTWEAMKWEYRMETAFTSWGNWYFAGRRWGDLPEGTPLHWPQPYQELDARREPLYSVGGVGGAGAQAFKGTYGL